MLARGRAVGGSTAVNAGYFIRAGASDRLLWETRLGWSSARVLEAYRRCETDLDLPHDPAHGSTGPILVRRPPQDDPVSLAVRHAAHTHGLGDVADVNAPDPGPGIAAVPRNAVDGHRWDTGRAYLRPLLNRANLQILSGATALTVEVETRSGRAPRATGVTVLVDGRPRLLRAPELILCAGAIGSAHLLLRSGIGPAGDLESLGRRVLVDLPVGTSISDHPQVSVRWSPGAGSGTGDPIRSVLHTGDLELLPLLTPTEALLGGGPTASVGDGLDLLIADQAPEARGRLRLDPRDPAGPPSIRYDYLASERDRATLRAGVRLAVDILNEAAGPHGSVSGPSAAELDSDADLDAWVRSRLGTALHLSGTAPGGDASDPDTVVDGQGRVHGVDGLRIADLSILPQVPSRGPAATAVMLGELLAEHDG
jgi:choline dehydrogenase